MREKRRRPEKYAGLIGNRNARKPPEQHRLPHPIVSAELTPELFRQINETRGDLSKSQFIRRALEAYLHSSKTSDEQNNG